MLVPSLDLLAQTEGAWREASRTGPVIEVSSLRGEEVSFPNTTDVDELVDWARHLERVTVFATYASLGLGTLERAHTAGMVIAPDAEGRPTSYVADKAWFDELFPVDLGAPAPTTSVTSINVSAAAGNMADAGAPTTAHGEAAVDPRDRLAALRRELPARVELVEGCYQKAVDAAYTLMTDFEEAHRLRVELGEDPLPAEQRIEWMEKLSKARAAAQASVTTLEQVEALILNV
ncbi:hypothetical protein [Streptomyces scopuliridis]|uniref:hypothetical protein n=1 Tax=Streptomyces scopuliridis TaxID=452529 RepID=UPI00367F0A38